MTRLRVREFTAQDAAPVAALHARAYPHSRWPSLAARAAYFREVLLHNPWVDAELPSWVAEDDEGIAGFMGVIPRPMRFGAKAVRVAVACQLMTDPDRRTGLAALELIRRYFSGPQDLCVADGANEASRQCWEAAGGATSPLHGLHWVRLLRPAQGVLQLAAARPQLAALASLARPLAALADACMPARKACARQFQPLQCEPLEAGALAKAADELRGAFLLRPCHDAASLAWLLAQVEQKRRYGPLHGAVMREAGGRTAGWFLYYLDSRMSQALQVGALAPAPCWSICSRMRAGAARSPSAGAWSRTWRRACTAGAACCSRAASRRWCTRATRRCWCPFSAATPCSRAWTASGGRASKARPASLPPGALSRRTAPSPSSDRR